jgi:selenocysteine-specific translation elongation factor
LISETSLADSRVFFDLNEAKNYLLQKESANLEGSPEVIIDHCFEVKGVGTVALGVVTKGGVKVHDSFTALPSEKTVDVKSIQKNDVDSREASCGDRVGLALRGVKAEEIERGTVFSKEKEKLTVAKEFECKITLGKFWRKPFESGAFHLNSGLQFEVARVELLDGIAAIKPRESGKAKITLEKPVVFSNAEIPLLCDLNAKGLRVIGKVEL